jgi:hypothetical protein
MRPLKYKLTFFWLCYNNGQQQKNRSYFCNKIHFLFFFFFFVYIHNMYDVWTSRIKYQKETVKIQLPLSKSEVSCTLFLQHGMTHVFALQSTMFIGPKKNGGVFSRGLLPENVDLQSWNLTFLPSIRFSWWRHCTICLTCSVNNKHKVHTMLHN